MNRTRLPPDSSTANVRAWAKAVDEHATTPRTAKKGATERIKRTSGKAVLRSGRVGMFVDAAGLADESSAASSQSSRGPGIRGSTSSHRFVSFENFISELRSRDERGSYFFVFILGFSEDRLSRHPSPLRSLFPLLSILGLGCKQDVDGPTPSDLEKLLAYLRSIHGITTP